MGKKQVKELAEMYCVYLAHRANGDEEGERMAVENIIDHLSRNNELTSAADRAFSEGAFDDLSCHECDGEGTEFTWQEFTIDDKGRITMHGDCGHDRVLNPERT